MVAGSEAVVFVITANQSLGTSETIAGKIKLEISPVTDLTVFLTVRGSCTPGIGLGIVPGGKQHGVVGHFNPADHNDSKDHPCKDQQHNGQFHHGLT